MKPEDRRLLALREYHAKRPEATREKLMEALDRIEHGNTVVLSPSAKLNKTNLCLEAGVCVHTLLAKDRSTGNRRYADVLERLDKLVAEKRRARKSVDDRDEKISELRTACLSLTEDKSKMALEIDRIGMALLREKDEVARLSAVEAQNADLREEIRLMQASAALRLVGKGRGKK